MKAVIICFLGLAVAALARPDTTYTDKYDNINLDEVLGNNRLLSGYMDCILEHGKCTSEGKELKSHIKDAMETNCAKCTDAQRKGSRRVISHLINHEPKYWEQLKAKFDSQGKYSKKYEDDLKAITA